MGKGTHININRQQEVVYDVAEGYVIFDFKRSNGSHITLNPRNAH